MADKYVEALRAAAERLLGAWRSSDVLSHPGLKGTERERAIIDMIRPILPKRYGLATGQVFDHYGTMSKQQDIIIFDDLFSTAFRYDEATALCAAESVFGSIEVKSQLDGSALTDAAENIASLKRLEREDSDALDITPTLRLNIGSGLMLADDSKKNHYIGVVVGMRGTSNLTSKLNSMRTDPETALLLPDLVVAIDPGVVICRCSQGANGPPKVMGPGHPYDEFLASEVGSVDALATLIASLGTLLPHVRLRERHPVDYMVGLLSGSFA